MSEDESKGRRCIPGEEASQQPFEEVAARLGTDVQTGLSWEEAESRVRSFGRNEFQAKKEEPLWEKYLEQFQNPLILLLLASSLVSVCMGQFDDACSIAIAVLIVVTVAFVQEYRSEKSLEELNKLVPPGCSCIRNGHVETFLARNLVPGDVVLLSTGDRVPADVRLTQVSDLAIDESSFTGETEPVLKHNLPVTGRREGMASKPNMAFMGTLVRCGNGRGVVTSTGESSQFGELFKLMQAEEAPKTPLQKSMDSLGKQLSFYSFAIIGLIMFFGWIQGRPLMGMFNIGVSLAVAAIPEGLPIVVTVTLALGVVRMASRKAIIKKLPTVETLGCVNVVCSDKTGTLTKNEMTLVAAVTSEGYEAEFSGVGYSNKGDVAFIPDSGYSNKRDVAFIQDSGYSKKGDVAFVQDSGYSNKRDVAFVPDGNYKRQISSLKRMIEVGCVCNNADIAGGQLRGQPTEGAIIVAAQKLDMFSVREKYLRLQEYPFSSDSKIMMVRCKSKFGEDGTFFVREREKEREEGVFFVKEREKEREEGVFFVKGCTERVVEMCRYYSQDSARLELSEERREWILNQSRFLGRKGLRVLAMAYGRRVESLVFVGVVGMFDPPRPGGREAIRMLQSSGVSVKMVTGDSEETACAIGARLGLYAAGNSAMSGHQMDSLDDPTLETIIPSVSLLYRVGPGHKLRIVKALQNSGLIVAMTGDGVNDGVALKRADIGIAMGKIGTDVSKEAADMILVDDDFFTIM